MRITGEIGQAATLRTLLRGDAVMRVIGAYDGMSARLGHEAGFDAIWASGLGISAAHGVPDCGILTMTELLAASEAIGHATPLPVIADCDTGFGDVNCLTRAVRHYERAGIAAICIEDKQLPKHNSFRDGHLLTDAPEFAAKLAAAKAAQTDPDLILIARLESLIAGAGQDDAIKRARLYARAGADALLVHSKARSPSEVLEFAAAWHAEGGELPLIVVPSTYPEVTLQQLQHAGIAAVIYANHSLRAALTAMRSTMNAIAGAGSTRDVEDDIASIQEVLALAGTAEAEAREAWFEEEISERRRAHLTRRLKLAAG